MYISDIVLCESVWVLQGVYGLARHQLGLTLQQLAAARQLAFDSSDRLQRAIQSFAAGRGDFADYMIRERARAAECETVLTFDQVLLDDEMFASP